MAYVWSPLLSPLSLSLAGQKVLMTLAVDRKGFPPGKLNSPARAPDMAAASSKRHFREPPLTSNLRFPLSKKVEPVTLRIGFSASRSKGKCLLGRFPADSEPLSPRLPNQTPANALPVGSKICQISSWHCLDSTCSDCNVQCEETRSSFCPSRLKV